MQSTLVLLAVLLATQLGERYPAPTDGSQTESSPTNGAQSQPPTTDPSTGQQPAQQSPSEEPPSASSLFDEIDAAAEPLNSNTQTAPSTPSGESLQGPTTQQSTAPALSTTPPASSQPPATAPPAAQLAVETDPAKVLAGIMEPPLGGQLQGTTLTLLQAVDNAPSRADQTQRVVAYWDLSQAVANYHLAQRERTELAALRQSVTTPGVDWDTARENTDDRLQLAADRVRVAQEHLAQLMGNTSPGFAPLPSDAPFCGAYETRFEQIFQSRPSALAQQLNELLPRLHKNLADCTQEIADARAWMFRVSDSRGPQTDGYELLRAYELFATRRKLFVGAVKEYNLGIVRYTEIATPGTLETDRLVGMLIRTGGSPRTAIDTEVQRANAEEPANPGGSAQPGASTSGWAPVQGNSGERSILVPRG